MSLIGALNCSSLAMMAQSQGMQTVSNNIANVNTTAYKREDTLFQTLLTAQRGTAAGRERMGVQAVDRREVWGQGMVRATGRADDLAINGDGFFMVTSSFGGRSETMYTRDGALQQRYVDVGNGSQQAFYTTAKGQYLLGWAAGADGSFNTSGALVPVRSFALDEINGQATTTALMAANVPANLPVGESVSLQGTVYDQAWNAQSLNYIWTKTGANAWTVDFAVGGGTVDPAMLGATAVAFTSSGKVLSPQGPVSVPITWDDGTTSTVAIDLSKMEQYADAKVVYRTDQNGSPAGRLYDESFDENGVLWGSYTNGHNRPLYKLAIAKFVAPNSLEAITGNLFRETDASGRASVRDLESQEEGTSLVVGSLEASNVDMADEFTRMMMVQKAYSMASTNFRTVDEMMQVASNLKR